LPKKYRLKIAAMEYSNMVYFNTGDSLDFYTASEFNYHLDYNNAGDLIAGIGPMDLKEFMATYEM
jgi:hypothetical protein